MDSALHQHAGMLLHAKVEKQKVAGIFNPLQLQKPAQQRLRRRVGSEALPDDAQSQSALQYPNPVVTPPDPGIDDKLLREEL